MTVSGRSVVGFVLAVVSLAGASVADAQVYTAAKTGGNYMHNYYLPPAASSTPWWPSWSPDGKRIAFAMDGSIWTIEVGGNVARELVFSAREYLSSPEYSPDGRWLAYTADDDGKSINLRVVNLATGASTNLTTGTQVNVEPAWSPDGKRLAYVSTAPNGYFNVFVMEVTDGKAGAITQVTTDNDFGRERLYFSPIDVHISPAWSPDGKELLLVSNRNIPLGSGGIWRVPVGANVMGSPAAKADSQGGDALPHPAAVVTRRQAHGLRLAPRRPVHRALRPADHRRRTLQADLRRARPLPAPLVARRRVDRLHLQRGRAAAAQAAQVVGRRAAARLDHRAPLRAADGHADGADCRRPDRPGNPGPRLPHRRRRQAVYPA